MGHHRAASWFAAGLWIAVRAWILTLASTSALWILFIAVFAPFGSEWYGFDQRAWILERLGNTTSVIIPATSFYFVPSLICSLPPLALLILLRAGRRPWLARLMYLASFLVFSLWWDRTLIADAALFVRYEHVGMLIAGWLIAARLFPRPRSGASMPMTGSEVSANRDEGSGASRAILRAAADA